MALLLMAVVLYSSAIATYQDRGGALVCATRLLSAMLSLLPSLSPTFLCGQIGQGEQPVCGEFLMTKLDG